MGKLSNLEFFTKVAETGEAPADGSRFIYPPAIAKTLGFRLIEVGRGTATMERKAERLRVGLSSSVTIRRNSEQLGHAFQVG